MACIQAAPRALLVMRHLLRPVTMVVATAAETVVETVVVTAAVMVVETVVETAVVMGTATATVIPPVMAMARRPVMVKAARAHQCRSSTRKAARLLSLC